MNQSQASNLEEWEQGISDSVITTKIKAKFAESKNLNPLKISVETQDGIVTLSGYVKDKQAFVDALRIAKDTQGVKGVKDNDLYIKKVNMAVTDAFITARVETAVLKAKVLDDESIPLVGINAKTVNGEVTLTGTVQSAQSLAYIIKRVNAIRGVKKIITLLEVKDNS
jgi:hyperosmotically inducible protein